MKWKTFWQNEKSCKPAIGQLTSRMVILSNKHKSIVHASDTSIRGSSKWKNFISFSFSLPFGSISKTNKEGKASPSVPNWNENKQQEGKSFSFLFFVSFVSHRTRTTENKISMEKPLPRKKEKKEKQTCVNISFHLSRPGAGFILISSGKICFSYFFFSFFISSSLEITAELLFLLHLMMCCPLRLPECLDGRVFEVSFYLLEKGKKLF